MDNDKRCGTYAAFRYTWPGRDESFICIEHAPQLAEIARAMGLHLQMIPVTPCEEKDHPTCQQIAPRQHT